MKFRMTERMKLKLRKILNIWSVAWQEQRWGLLEGVI